MMSKIFKRFQSSRVEYTNKELFDRFTTDTIQRINREQDMQNTALKFILSLTLTGMGALYAHTDKRFEQVEKRFEQVDKRFEHLESELKEIKSLIIAFSKK